MLRQPVWEKEKLNSKPEGVGLAIPLYKNLFATETAHHHRCGVDATLYFLSLQEAVSCKVHLTRQGGCVFESHHKTIFLIDVLSGLQKLKNKNKLRFKKQKPV